MAKKMRAAQVPQAKGAFEIVERNIPEPQARWERVKVEPFGVCHSRSLPKKPALEYGTVLNSFHQPLSP
ncbi:MAG: hypothetical protein ABJB97_08650 [Acidobacteriota bacterium]